MSVPAWRLDRALAELDVNDLTLVWVDTQGHEAHVLAGATETQRCRVPWVIEYWPYGLRRANGIDLLHSLIAENFSTIVDVRRSAATNTVVQYSAADIDPIVEWLPGGRNEEFLHNYTDLLLLP